MDVPNTNASIAAPAPIPFAARRAYAAAAPQPQRGGPVDRVELSAEAQSHASAAARVRGSNLVAARVAAPINFDPAPTNGDLVMHRRPADANAAATGVNLGRILDAQG